MEFKEEHKTLIEETNRLVKELREKHEKAEKGQIPQSEFKAFQEKVENRLSAIADRETEIKAANDRIDVLETKINRPGVGNDNKNEEKAFRKKAFEAYLRKGIGELTPEEQKALIISDMTTGGYLAEEEYVKEIIKGVVEISPIRSLAKVRTTSHLSVNIPKKTGSITATWGHETGTIIENTGLTYGLEKSTPHVMTALMRVTRQDVEDSSFNIEGEITSEISEQFGVLEGTGFVTGDAVGKPEGLLTNSSISEVVSGDANLITGDGLINLTYALKAPYARNASFLMKRATVGKVRLMKDGSNRYLWMPSFVPGQPQTLLGYPVHEAVDMPAVAAGSYPVLFGDFRKGYIIVDRVQIEIQRLVEKYAEYGQIGFIARKRVDGQVVLPEAIVKQKISA